MRCAASEWASTCESSAGCGHCIDRHRPVNEPFSGACGGLFGNFLWLPACRLVTLRGAGHLRSADRSAPSRVDAASIGGALEGQLD